MIKGHHHTVIDPFCAQFLAKPWSLWKLVCLESGRGNHQSQLVPKEFVCKEEYDGMAGVSVCLSLCPHYWDVLGDCSDILRKSKASMDQKRTYCQLVMMGCSLSMSECKWGYQ